jgi:hypothetical protein
MDRREDLDGSAERARSGSGVISLRMGSGGTCATILGLNLGCKVMGNPESGEMCLRASRWAMVIFIDVSFVWFKRWGSFKADCDRSEPVGFLDYIFGFSGLSIQAAAEPGAVAGDSHDWNEYRRGVVASTGVRRGGCIRWRHRLAR